MREQLFFARTRHAASTREVVDSSGATAEVQPKVHDLARQDHTSEHNSERHWRYVKFEISRHSFYHTQHTSVHTVKMVSFERFKLLQCILLL
jgi:hypothetical protein